MNKYQNDQQQTGVAITNTFNKYPQDYSGDTILKPNIDVHKANMADITFWDKAQRESMELDGITRDKNFMRDFMNPLAYKAVGAIKSFAAKTNNKQLAASVKYSEAKLKRMGEAAFIGACNSIAGILTTNAQALIPYGIEAQFITSFKADISTYTTMSAARRTKVGRNQTCHCHACSCYPKHVGFCA